MSFSFRPAIRENVGLLIGLAGGTGSGKTFSAMRLAAGIAGDKPFCVIDTEAGRAKHYADQFKFDHGDLKPPFSPERYAEAIAAADAAGYTVIVVDSMSHEHAGEGGLLDMQEAEFQRMGARDAVKMSAWIKPKGEHKKMVSKLLQVRANLILCFRAEEKVEMSSEKADLQHKLLVVSMHPEADEAFMARLRKQIESADSKMKIRPKSSPHGIDGWVPVAEKNLPYELTASFLLTADAPGIPKPIKLQSQHRELFPLDKPITEESGRRLAQWASGGEKKAEAQAQPSEIAPSQLADDAIDRVSKPVVSAPGDVDTDTGEIIKRFPLYIPGRQDAYALSHSLEEWKASLKGVSDSITKSPKLSPAKKEEKLRALKKSNDVTVREFGTLALVWLNGEIAARVVELQAEAAELKKNEESKA